MEPSSATTRERVLEAASELFAQRGFRRASARAISAHAGANAAAISYHFRGKRGLYEAVLTYAPPGQPGCIGATELVDRPADPASCRLHTFIHGWLSRLLGNGFDAWQAQVAARELVEPVGGLSHEAQDAALRPLVQLETLVRGILPRASDEAVRYCMLSIAGQCLFYFNCRAIIQRLYSKPNMAREEIQLTADHITCFSVTGMATVGYPTKASGLDG
jgi:AcrR family transcriptional regulator